jgi:hypothetical protein
MSDHVDQVDARTMGDARVMMAAMHELGYTDEHPDCLSDEEVLEEFDRKYPGGSAQFVREQTGMDVGSGGMYG